MDTYSSSDGGGSGGMEERGRGVLDELRNGEKS